MKAQIFPSVNGDDSMNTPSNRILIVDDDEELAELVTEYLRREGMEADVINDGENGLQRALEGDYAALVLDVMLPGIGGFEVLRRLRASAGTEAKLPVLMLTARGDEVDRVLGLEIGADDYLPKPFSSRELVARLRAILRRARPEPATEIAPVVPVEVETLSPAPARRVLRVSDIELDPSAREARRGGDVVDITSVEFDLLNVLLRSAGEVVPRETISRKALGRELMPFDRSIDVHISNLRRKLGPDSRGSERIKSIRGVGYIYVLPSEELDPENSV